MVNFIIPGRLAGLNEYTESNRSNPRIGNRVKRNEQKIVTTAIRNAHLTPIHKPVVVYIDWYEKDNRRYVKQIVDTVHTDKDNPRIEVELIEVY